MDAQGQRERAQTRSAASDGKVADFVTTSRAQASALGALAVCAWCSSRVVGAASVEIPEGQPLSIRPASDCECELDEVDSGMVVG
jgi:hypothetical protein